MADTLEISTEGTETNNDLLDGSISRETLSDSCKIATEIAHNELYSRLKNIVHDDIGFDKLFMGDIRNRQYNCALRHLSSSEHRLIPSLILIMLEYKDKLGISPDQPDNNHKTALDLAQEMNIPDVINALKGQPPSNGCVIATANVYPLLETNQPFTV
jgi:hypothetical protein